MYFAWLVSYPTFIYLISSWHVDPDWQSVSFGWNLPCSSGCSSQFITICCGSLHFLFLPPFCKTQLPFMMNMTLLYHVTKMIQGEKRNIGKSTWPGQYLKNRHFHASLSQIKYIEDMKRTALCTFHNLKGNTMLSFRLEKYGECD